MVLQKKIISNKFFLIFNAAIALSILALMNFKLIPAISAAAQGMQIFDLRFMGYDLEYVHNFLMALSPTGREIYLKQQLPLDFVFPIFYSLVFMGLALRLPKKTSVTALSLTALLFLCDYLENLLSLIFLRKEGLDRLLISFASASTIAKTVLLLVLITLILTAYIFMRVKKLFKSKA